MAAAEDLVRPEPLPLVSSISRGDPIDAERDPTLIAPSEILRPDPDAGTDLATVTDRSSTLLPEHRSSVPAVSRGSALRTTSYDRFVDTRPPRRWPIAVGIAIVMILALGALGVALADKASSNEVPNLRDKPESELLDVAARNGWVTVRVDARDNDVAAGNIIETDPPSGRALDKGQTLTYYVSRGKPLVAVPPDVIGKATAEGRELLIQAGFNVAEPQVVFDETAPKGTVMRIVDEANKPATSEAPKGSTLKLVVSNGPDQRAVPPGLENQPKDTVLNALKALRLNPQLKEDFNETVPKDMVISVDPVPGTKLDVDAVVTVNVSKGPEPRLVPNTVGMTLNQATTALEGAGFKIKGVTGSPSGRVLATDPPPNERYPKDTLVQIYMRTS
jgi:eukaryotic-like serine/threonine-protein kinase